MIQGQHPIQIQARWMREVGARFKAVRKAMNLTQHDMAHKLNWSNSTVSIVENGKVRGDATLRGHIKSACGVLAVSADWMLHNKGNPPELVVGHQPKPAPTPPLTEQPQVLNVGLLQRAGRRIRAGRNAMGMSQAKFALLAHTDSGTLSAIERGASQRHFELHAQACCTVLGVSYSWLFQLENGIPVDITPESIGDQLARVELKLDMILAALKLN